MSGTWVTPKTWLSEPLTSADLNIYVRDNMAYLKDPPTSVYTADESADYQTTSTVFVSVDNTNFDFSLETWGGAVLVSFYGSVKHSSIGIVCFDLEVDGSRLGGSEGLVVASWPTANGQIIPVSFQYLLTGLNSGTAHIIELMWRTTGGTATLYAGAGTTNGDCLPQLWAREVS